MSFSLRLATVILCCTTAVLLTYNPKLSRNLYTIKMPKYKLTYLDFRCRGEPIRMLFYINGVEFEDIVVPGDEWPAVKHTYPLKTVPVLEVDDFMITQSKAILRYLGREFGNYGKTNLEGAQIDCVMDVCDEIITESGQIYFYQGPGAFDKDRFVVEKKDVLKNFNEKVVPELLGKLQTLFEMNKNPDGYFVGEELTIADLHYFATFDYVECFKKDAFEGYPKMAALYEKILLHKKVAEWLKKTDYMKHPWDQFKEKLKDQN